MCLHLHTHTQTCTGTYLHMDPWWHIHTCIHIHMHVQAYVYTSAHACRCTHMLKHVCTHIHTSAHTVHAHTSTYTHVCTCTHMHAHMSAHAHTGTCTQCTHLYLHVYRLLHTCSCMHSHAWPFLPSQPESANQGGGLSDPALPRGSRPLHRSLLLMAQSRSAPPAPGLPCPLHSPPCRPRCRIGQLLPALPQPPTQRLVLGQALSTGRAPHGQLYDPPHPRGAHCSPIPIPMLSQRGILTPILTPPSPQCQDLASPGRCSHRRGSPRCSAVPHCSPRSPGVYHTCPGDGTYLRRLSRAQGSLLIHLGRRTQGQTRICSREAPADAAPCSHPRAP